ncbi:MAG: polymerase gamma and tau subunit [Chlamydiota bacterium]|jgi:DNA polymerase-3 subunit gamma/tau
MNAQYQALARRFRPSQFADLVGQDAVRTTLQNALRKQRVAHAYLFSGPRGVGKTTVARLFAKAINCTALSTDLEPCDKCPSCVEIGLGQSLDVIEIDGASNRGIDDIRQINETIGYAPSPGRKKIVIIDEVHMLTKEAFNALLKNVEEPPAHAKFFFATTEPHKVPATIVSRCQRFDLRRLDETTIIGKLTHIVREVKDNVGEGVLHLIAHLAEGSLRDAESLLDQLLCFASAPITVQSVQSLLGLAGQELFFDLDRAFADGKAAYAFELSETLFRAGKDPSHFLTQLIEHARLLSLATTVGPKALPLHVETAYTKSAAHYSRDQALYLFEYVVRMEPEIHRSVAPKVTLETILLHWIKSRHRLSIDAIARRLVELESALTAKEPMVEMSAAIEDKKHAPQLASVAPPAIDPQPVLKPVPFAPSIALQPVPDTDSPLPFQKKDPTPEIPKAYIDTIVQFAAVELEGSVKRH